MIIHGESLSEVITKNYPQLIPFRYLYLNDERGFISYINSTKQVNGDDGEYTLLQYACKHGLQKVVKELLILGADPNKILETNPRKPIFIASFRGFNVIIKTFMLRSLERIDYQTNEGSVLHEVIKGSNEKHNERNSKSCNHIRSLKILLDKNVETNIFDINLVDERGNTCLHYAVQNGNIDYIELLLDNGAYICKKNNLSKSPLDYISHDLLKSYLNKCVKTNDVSPNQEEHEIICSYKFLCPPKVFIPSTETKLKNQNIIVENISEVEPLRRIGDNPELRPLLMHPVLNCFLLQKWLKVKHLYMVNAILYLGFLIFLNLYISFICTSNTDHNSGNNTDNNTDNNTVENEWKNILRLAVWVFLTFLVLRELFHFILSPISFILSPENWIELCLIILTSYLLCNDLPNEHKIALCIIIIQLSFGEFTCISSRHPMMSLQWEMFKVVTKNFLSFLVWCSFIIVAFVFCFSVLLKNTEEEKNDNKHLFFMFFKVIIMLTGELDSDKLQTELTINKLVIILFVFFIPVVLVNLLVGLAVSDTQEIKNDAEIVGIVSRINCIYVIESSVVSDKCMAVNENQSKNFIRKIISYSMRYCGLKLMVFSDAQKNTEIKIFPNRNNVIEFKSSESSSLSSCTSKLWRHHIDNDCVKRAKLIIKLNSKEREEDTTEKITEIFYSKCIDIENTIKEIRELSNAMNS